MKRRYLLITMALFIYWLCSSSFLRINPGIPVRYISDEFDRWDFFNRGLWLPEGKVPYLDTFSEYPQISTYLFGIIHLPFLDETDSILAYGKYSNLFSLIMLYSLLALIIVIDKELSDERKNLVLLLLLPGPLYFTYNRFDILPSLMSVLALLMVKREKWDYAAVMLGIGTLTKWYPALLVPAILTYMYYGKEPWKKIRQFTLIFGVTCILIILPTFIAGGVRALLIPYVNLQTKRGYDLASFLGLTLPLLQHVTPFINPSLIRKVLLVMQFSAIPLFLLVRIDTFGKLLNSCLIAIAAFMMFAPLYSPQWMLWIVPLMILAARTKWDIFLIVVYGVMTYIEFPLVCDLFGFESSEMMIMGWVNIVLLLLIMIQAAGRLRKLQGTPLSPAN